MGMAIWRTSAKSGNPKQNVSPPLTQTTAMRNADLLARLAKFCLERNSKSTLLPFLKSPVQSLLPGREILLPFATTAKHTAQFSPQSWLRILNYGRGSPSLSQFRFSPHLQPRWSRGGGFFLSPNEKALYGLIGANACVFLGWNFIDSRFMRDHFTCSMFNLEQGRLHTLITSAFSHFDFWHLFPNMLGLYFFGRSVADIFGGHQLLRIYLLGALVGCMADTVLKYHNARGSSTWFRRDPATLGASGSVNAITTLYICLFPRQIIYLNLFIPVPAFLLGLMFLLNDFTGVFKQDNVSHAGHLGGVAVGALYFLRYRFGRL